MKIWERIVSLFPKKQVPISCQGFSKKRFEYALPYIYDKECLNSANCFYRSNTSDFMIAFCDSCSEFEYPNIKKCQLIKITRKEYEVFSILNS